MSRTAHKLLSASGSKGAYEIDQSIMLDDGDGALLHRTPSSEGNRKTWTFSCWFKRSQQDSTDNSSGYYYLFASSIYGGNETFIRVQGDHLHVAGYDGGSTDFSYYSYGLFRDLAAWYHVVVICDTTESAEADRVKIYLNGETVSWDTPNHASLNFDTMINNTNWHAIGAYRASSGDGGLYRWDGYVAEAYLLDGTAKAITDFGETDSETGQWIPKKTGFSSSEYGTNGFYLKFVSGAIGTDSSGEGNNYTTVNLANADVMLDSPTNNYCTLNGNQTYNSDTGTLRQGNLFFVADTYNSGHYSNVSSTFNVPSSGKWYAECRISIEAGGGNVTVFGVTDQKVDWDAVGNENLTGMDGFFTSLYSNYIKVVDSGTLGGGNTSATATSYILGMALDVDNGYAYFGVDSGSAMVWYQADGSTSGGDPTSGSNGTGGFARTFTIDDTITVSTSVSSSGGDGSQNHLNFGQNGTFSGTETAGGNADANGEGNFFRAPPSGYKALCTKNLPDPTIKLSTEHFNTVLYTGSDNDAVSQSVTGVGFEPDLVWIKKRNATASPAWWDQVRGEHKGLNSDANDAEITDTYGLETFDSDGFTVRESQSAQGQVNTGTLVAWNWKANGSGSANTDGTINTTSTSVNTTAGFSIGTYTGEGGLKTVGHGLGKVPAFIIVKCRSNAIDWCVYHQGAASSPEDGSLSLNDTAAFDDNDNRWNDTAPTSSVFTVYSSNEVNDSGKTYVYYAFAEIEGFSKFGSFYGTSHVNGTAVVTGFRPAWTMIKRIDAANSWIISDSKISPINLIDDYLAADLTQAEATTAAVGIDFLSNGFKLKNNANAMNNSSGTYVYMAFAESPFKYANAR